MKKTRLEKIPEGIPESVRGYFIDTEIYDSSCSDAVRVYYTARGYYIKRAEKGRLLREASLGRIFHALGLGAEVIEYVSEAEDLLITKEIAGEDMTHYTDSPELICEIMAKALKKLHSMPTEGVPEVDFIRDYDGVIGIKNDCVIHGDFCLPNVLAKDGKFTGMIDFDHAGVGDRHIDIYWATWSLQFNLGTDKYSGLFIDLYGKESFDPEVFERVKEIEARH